MSRPTDDLSQDPFASDNLPQDQTFADNMRDVAVDKASNYVRQAPKRMVRRFLWSIILSFTFTNEYEKERLLNRVESGGKITFHEALFGTKFSIFGLIRTLIFFAIIGGVVFYMWQNDLFSMIMEQQALLESIQATPMP